MYEFNDITMRKEALAFVKEIVVPRSTMFDSMTKAEIKMHRLRAKEMRIYEGLRRGFEAYQAGDFVTADDADARIRANTPSTRWRQDRA